MKCSQFSFACAITLIVNLELTYCGIYYKQLAFTTAVDSVEGTR